MTESATDLGCKTFAMEDQRLMARWSGDHNPMHVDAVAARRLLTGRPVVHGVHLVLEALERWCVAGATSGFRRLRAEFIKPVSVGDEVHFRARYVDIGIELVAAVDGLLHMSLQLDDRGGLQDPEALPDGELLHWKDHPFDHAPDRWLGRTVMLPPVDGVLPSAERVAELMGSEAVALLGQASTMVGMGCPGLHSVFSSLQLTRRNAAGPARCRVDRFDPRFGLVRMSIDGAWHGEIRAFVRATPQRQANMDEVAAHLRSLPPVTLPSEHCTWVLGGSRGLGELAAKIAAAAGSRVILTYAAGEDDARRVAAEINAAGGGPAAITRYESGRTDIQALCDTHGLPNSVLFFATPRIAQRRTSPFQAELLAGFNAIYGAEPARIALALEACAEAWGATRVIDLFSPSSTYIDDLPNGMVEYAMAKAAAEVLARDFNKRLHHVRMVCQRLPKLPTDQTNALLADKSPSALAVLGPLLLDLLPGH